MFFFTANYMTSRVFRGFERLSCSFWRQVMASYSQRWNSPQISVFGSKILTIFWFLSHNFTSRYASKSVKGSKDSISSQESKKTLSKKNFVLAWGPGKVGPNMLSLWRNTQRTQNPSQKIFFTISSWRLAEFVEGLINSLALLVGKLWLAKVCP